MSQFCIDLKDVMLPDAIAALVEAWYEAQMEEERAISELKLKVTEQKLEDAIDSIISTLNQSPKIKGTKLAIERRGQKLCIRGLLPKKLDPTNQAYQRIPLGIAADQRNLKVAEIALLVVIDQLKGNDFSWAKWKDDEYIAKIIANANSILNPSPVAA